MSGTNVPARVTDDEARIGSDVTPAADAAAAPPQPPVLSVGQQLGAARRARGLTADDVAKALKLSLRQVEALEADDWPSLPCKTIIRGFVRNYARLLGLNPDLLMTALDQLTMPQGPELEMSVGTPVSIPQEGKVDRRDFVRALSGLIVLLLAIAAYFFFPQELWLSTLSAFKTLGQSAEVAAEKAVPAEPEAATAPAAAPPATTAPAEVPPTPTISAPASTSAAASNPVGAAATVNASASVLYFSFAQPSWVEVRDRSGQVVFSKKNEAGSVREVEGQPPFALVIGNSAYVTLQYKGKVIDLSKRSKDDVARLTLE